MIPNKLYYTVVEASELCDVSKPTIMNAIKRRNMKFFKDDRGVIHIYGHDLMDYYQERTINKVNDILDKMHSCIHNLRLTNQKYLKTFAELMQCDEDEIEAATKAKDEAMCQYLEQIAEYRYFMHALNDLQRDITKVYEVNL